MADRVDVDPDTLEVTADWLDRAARDLTDAVDKQMRAVRAFIGGDWRGTAAGSHEGPWADWEDGARRVIESFAADAGALRTAASGFTKQDTTTAGAITHATSSLDLPEVR